VGGTGYDTYMVDVITDVVVELAGEGKDSVLANVSGYTLGAEVENLTLIGTAAGGAGNGLNNLLTGTPPQIPSMAAPGTITSSVRVATIRSLEDWEGTCSPGWI